MDIQWYPGHMAKTRRVIREQVKIVDVVVEVVDARVPKSSRNPDLPQLVGGKPRVIALTKTDLADPDVTQRWVALWKREGFNPVLLDLLGPQGAKPLTKRLNKMADEVAQQMRERGRQPRPLRVLVAGVPNVGKSSLINRLAGRATARVGAKAGVTRGKQWIRVGSKMQLLDTPGILWPKFDDPHVAFSLAVTGAISDEVYDWQAVTIALAEFLVKRYKDRLLERYNLHEVPAQGTELIEAVGRRRGLLISGGRVDFEEAARLLLQEFRTGKLGRVTLDVPCEEGEIMSHRSLSKDRPHTQHT